MIYPLGVNCHLYYSTGFIAGKIGLHQSSNSELLVLSTKHLTADPLLCWLPCLVGATFVCKLSLSDSQSLPYSVARENGYFDEHVSDISLNRMVPILDTTPSHRHKSLEYSRGVDSLINCLDAMFQSKIIEARKYVPSLIQSLKSGILSDVLMPALVDRFWQYGVLLSSEQFDLVVKLLNSALVDEKSAMTLLPLMTVIYRVSVCEGCVCCVCVCNC